MHPYPNFNAATVKIRDSISNFIPLFFWAFDYVSKPSLKLFHLSIRGPCQRKGQNQCSTDIRVIDRWTSQQIDSCMITHSDLLEFHSLPQLCISISMSICFIIIYKYLLLNHWGRVTDICDSKLPIIGFDNGLSPGRRQAIIWTNAGILLIRTSGTNFSEILSEIHIFSFKKMHFKWSSGMWRPFCPGLNVLMLSRTKQGYVCPMAPGKFPLNQLNLSAKPF